MGDKPQTNLRKKIFNFYVETNHKHNYKRTVKILGVTDQKHTYKLIDELLCRDKS
jgi:hypothetical protein